MAPSVTLKAFSVFGALWHISQLADTTGLCALAFMSFGWSEECGLWQTVQDFVCTG